MPSTREFPSREQPNGRGGEGLFHAKSSEPGRSDHLRRLSALRRGVDEYSLETCRTELTLTEDHVQPTHTVF